MPEPETRHDLLFRRQYVITPDPCPELAQWQSERLDSLWCYVHPECDLTLVREGDRSFVLIGYILDPGNPEASNRSILTALSVCRSPDEIAGFLYRLSGRFVLVAKLGEAIYCFNDACGLRSVYYAHRDGRTYIASQPSLLGVATTVQKGKKFEEFTGSRYFSKNKEHWVPAGDTVFEDVRLLIPNHYLDMRSGESVRFFPRTPLAVRVYDDAVKEFGELLQKTMVAAGKRFPLALSLTCGLDSRLLLSACRPIAKGMYYFTLQYRDLKTSAPDISIPQRLLRRLGLEHHVIDCRRTPDPAFEAIYKRNAGMDHFDDWGVIAYGISRDFPSGLIATKGNCTEIARCYYRPSGRYDQQPISAEELLRLDPGWQEIETVRRNVQDWLDELRSSKAAASYDPLDLFYWEHRMGSWQAQSQHEWDIVEETFTPLNNRALLDTALGVDAKWRCFPDYTFFKEVMRSLWPEVLSEPINPAGLNVFKTIRKALDSMGLLGQARKLKSLRI